MNQVHLFLRSNFLAMLVGTVLASSIASGQVLDGSDPHVPGFVRGIDKRDYLLRRAEQIGLLRGLPHDLPYDPRVRAMQLMEQQQRAIAKASGQTDVISSVNSAGWTAIGPSPIPNGQTVSTPTAVSGRVTCISVHPTNPDKVYVGTAQGGLYRSLDGGSTWTALMDDAQSLSIGAIAIDPVTPTTIFVGTGEGNLSGDSYFGVGLYRITNAESVTPTLDGPFEAGSNTSNGHAFAGTSITSIVVDPNNDNNLFVGNTFGIGGVSGTFTCCGGTNPASGFIGLYFSNNALSASPTFSLISSASLPGGGFAAVTDLEIEPGNANTLLLCLEDFNSFAPGSGIYRSINALSGTSATFTRTLNFSGSDINVRFAVNKISSTVTVMAATEQSSGTLRISTDGGVTWPTTIAAVSGFCDGQCFYDMAPALDPSNSSIMYLGGSADGTSSFVLKKSTNGGTTWSADDIGLHPDVHAVTIAPSNSSIIYTGNDGGVWRSTNAGGTWTSLNNTAFNATQFESIALHPSDHLFSIGGTQDNGTVWLKPDSTWMRADFGDGGFALIDQNAVNTTNVTMYHTYFNQSNNLIGLARVTNTSNATDNGWAFLGCGGTPNGISCSDATLFFAPMALGPGNPNTLYFGTDHLYRSTNQGTTMTAVSQVPIVTNVPISAIGISPQDDNVRIVGLRNGKVFATTTGSSTLTDVTGSIPAKYVARAMIDPNHKDTAYVTLSGYGISAHVWKNTSLSGGGSGWAAASGSGLTSIPDVPVNAFVIDPANSNTLYAGTDIGVYNSTDGGQTWNPFGTGLPRVAVFGMAMQSSSGLLRIATHGRGMWEIPQSPLPIQLALFNVRLISLNRVEVSWSTVSEVNNYGFEVQKSTDKRGPYNTIPGAFVAGHGTTLVPQHYAFTDTSIAQGIWFYRLKQVDLDGTIHYTEGTQSTIATNVTEGQLPSEFSLMQNYPNPFNPTTSIKYQIPNPAHVTLTVYDVLGRAVATLVNEVKEPGVYSAQWGGSEAASGVYYYRLQARQISGGQAGDFVSVKKMSLLR